MKHRMIRAGLAAVLLTFACHAPAIAQEATRGEVAAKRQAPAATQKYLRFSDDGDAPRLSTSIVRYKTADGVRVDLIGAVHVADASYYKALNERFKAYDVLLYEMVKPKAMANLERRSGERSGGGWISMFQQFMKNQLDLSFQLDQVDYTAPNFVHADLDAETFAERQAARGENMITLMLDSMMREMAKAADARPGAAEPVGIMDLINALQAPDRPRQLKLVMARQFEQMDEALDAMGGDGSVIIGERNKHALKVLKEQMDAGKKHIGIFYGAGHLKGMDELMTTLMGFKQDGEPEWIVAWDLREPRVGGPTTAPATRPAQAR